MTLLPVLPCPACSTLALGDAREVLESLAVPTAIDEARRDLESLSLGQAMGLLMVAAVCEVRR